MDPSGIHPSTVALAVAAGLMLLVGSYTDNTGFQVAGLIVGVVAVITGINQARSRRDSRGDEPK